MAAREEARTGVVRQLARLERTCTVRGTPSALPCSVRCSWAGAWAGGDDALALSISKLTGWRVGRCYLFTDLSVLALSLTYIPVVKIAFSLITVTISSAVIDVVKDASWDHVEQFTEWLREKRRARA